MAPIVRSGASVARSFSSAVAPEPFYQISHLPDPFSLLSDSLSALANQALSIPSQLTYSGTDDAAAITVAVIAADVAILSYYLRTRPRRRHAVAHAYENQPVIGNPR